MSCSRATTARSSRSENPVNPGDLVRRPLGRQRVDAEVLGAQLPAAVGLEEVIDRGGPGDRQHSGGLQHLERLRDVGDASGGPRAAIGESQHGDRQRDVGLDGLDDLADPGGLGGGGAHHPLARLDQNRETLDGLECLCQAAAGSRAAVIARGLLGDLFGGPPAVALALARSHWARDSRDAGVTVVRSANLIGSRRRAV